MISRNKFKSFILLILILTLINPMRLSSAEETPKKVLLLYDKRNCFGYTQDIVTSYKELFGHFNVKVIERREENYQKQEMNSYDYVFVLGIEGKFSNIDLVNDLKKTNKTVCWIGKGVDRFLEDNENIGLSYRGEYDNLVKIHYKGKSFDIGIIDDFVILDMDNDDAQVYSWLSDGNNHYPYILKEKNFWFVSRCEIHKVLFYIFADVLYDVFEEYDFDKNRVFIRIEDVHPFRDLKKLREIGEYLSSKNIPFMIALIPAYKNPNSQYITQMSEKPDFVDTIKYLQKLGGSIILHGYTHESFGGDVSGEGFEFWDGINDKPLDLDIEEWIYERIGMGVQECVSNGIYPLAFEAPHYAISQQGYKILKRYFSTYCGHLQTSDQGFTTTSYPYVLYDTELFNKLVPENLGYVDPENPLAINDIENNLKKVSVVRGFMGGVFFHPYIDIKYLKEIVEVIESNNFQFYDLKQESNWVKWENISIISKDGTIYVNDSKKAEASEIEKNLNLVIKILIVFVFAINTVLLLIFIYSKIKANKRLFGE